MKQEFRFLGATINFEREVDFSRPIGKLLFECVQKVKAGESIRHCMIKYIGMTEILDELGFSPIINSVIGDMIGDTIHGKLTVSTEHEAIELVRRALNNPVPIPRSAFFN